MFPRTALTASARRFAHGATASSTSSTHSLLNLNRSCQPAATCQLSTLTAPASSPLRSYLLNRSSIHTTTTTRSLFTSSSSTSCAARPAAAAAASNGSAPFSSSFFYNNNAALSFPCKHQSKTSSTSSVFSRSYTSVPSPPSSASSTATATAARVLAEESSSVTATAVAGAAGAARTPLSFHEEMTKVRFSFNWWKEWTIIMGVFAVTGSSTVMVVKPLVKEVFQLDGSMREGPWSFRFAYLCTTLPLYSCVLLTVATIAGRRPYFKKVVLRMWGRFLPKKVIQRFQ